VKPQFDLTSDLSLTWIGEGTVIVHLDGINLITDPDFGQGDGEIIRTKPPPCDLEDLPEVCVTDIFYSTFQF
jgi:L-ascorbate metabolism protein UlaG (beta-lactamase superfamily)